jgi:hypothetical protein
MIKFSCPGCGQHIECDAGIAGTQVHCPVCQVAMVVPGTALTATLPPPSTGPVCPGCGAALATGAVLCTSCGMNLRTGKRIQPQTTPSFPGQRRAVNSSSRLSGSNTIIVAVLVVFAALFGMGFMNPTFALAYLVLQGIFSIVVGIMILVCAFREGAGQGFLTLCVPCYVLYFVYGRCDSPLIKILFSISILTRLAGLAPPFTEALGR